MSYVLSSRARRDLQDLYRGPHRSRAYAKRVGTRIAVVIAHLVARPHIGVPTGDGCRTFTVSGTPYKIVFRELGPDIEIVRVFHASQQPPANWTS